MDKLVLYRPRLEELSWREKWLGDSPTMSYNHAFGGTIAFPRERWTDWYARWMEDDTGTHFYRYLQMEDGGEFVGNVSYHYDEEFQGHICEVLVAARYRGRGFGRQGLELLCEAARENGIKRLADNIAIDNPAAELFQRCGFRERLRNGEYILMEKEL